MVEPWQMTLEQYAVEKGARPDWVTAGYGETYRFHKRAVERAIREGKPVPAEVLKDYPELAKVAPVTPEVTKNVQEALNLARQERPRMPGAQLDYDRNLREALGKLSADEYKQYLDLLYPEVAIPKAGSNPKKEFPIIYEARLWRKWANMDDVTRPFATEKEAYGYLTHLKYIAKAGDTITVKRSQEWDIKVLHRETIDKDGQYWAIRKPYEPIPTEPKGGNPESNPDVYTVDGIEITIKYISPGIHEVSFLAPKEGLSEETLTKIDNLIQEKTGEKLGNPVRPKCPECGKLDVEMVETPTKWICPRCNYKIPKISTGGNPMAKTEQERKSFHERIFGKGSTPPLTERLGGGQAVNDMLPMLPSEGPPLPRVLGLKWPWKD